MDKWSYHFIFGALFKKKAKWQPCLLLLVSSFGLERAKKVVSKKSRRQRRSVRARRFVLPFPSMSVPSTIHVWTRLLSFFAVAWKEKRSQVEISFFWDWNEKRCFAHSCFYSCSWLWWRDEDVDSTVRSWLIVSCRRLHISRRVTQPLRNISAAKQ